MPAAVMGSLEAHVAKLARGALLKHRPAGSFNMDEALQHLEALREAFMQEFFAQALQPAYQIAHGLLVELVGCAELNQDSLEPATAELVTRLRQALGGLPRPI